MKEKVNIAELLKDCPIGMELYSPIYGPGRLTKVTDRIHVKFPKEHNVKCFRPDGKVSEDGEIMLYPEGKTTWEGFVPPYEFKNGDIISDGSYIAIFYKIGTPCYCSSPNVVYYHCYYGQKYCIFKKGLDFGIGTSTKFKYATEEEKKKLFDAIKENGYKWNADEKKLEKSAFRNGDIISTETGRWIGIVDEFKFRDCYKTYVTLGDGTLYYNTVFSFERLATEEEKKILFDAIKEKGYKWNADEKKLEKLVEPKFKTGDRVVKKSGISNPIQITGVGDTFYYTNLGNSVGVFGVAEQDDWELVPAKFDISTFIPFESRVLVRDRDGDSWLPATFGCILKGNDYPFFTMEGGNYKQCIPFDENKELAGTADSCDKYYRTWEK